MAMIKFSNTSGGSGLSITPSSFQWDLQDVSDSQSGRTQDGLMHKNRITQKRKLEMEFVALTPSQMAALLQAINQEYFYVTYPDALSGNVEERLFYVGDRKAKVYTWQDNGMKLYSSTSFNVIER